MGRDKWERNGVDRLCWVRGRLGHVTPADDLPVSVRGSLLSAIASCRRRETVGLLANPAVQEITRKARRSQTEERPGRRIGLC
jgi:hypothetical protein